MPAPLLKKTSSLKRTVSGSGGAILRSRSKSTSFDVVQQQQHISSLRSVSFGSTTSNTPTNSFGGDDDNDNDNATAASMADEQENDDPLLSLFRVHNTNRVKFDLASNEDDNHASNHNKQASSDPSSSSSSSSSNNLKNSVKKLVRIPSFKRTPSNLTASCLLTKTTSSDLDVNDPEDALIKKMLEPTPMRRINSFLDNMKRSNSTNSNSSSSKLEEEKGITLDDVEAVQFQQPTNIDNVVVAIDTTNIDGNNSNSNSNSNSNINHTKNRAKIPTSSKESIAKLLKKAQRAHKKSFRYRLAMKYYLLALKEMTAAGYEDNDPLTIKVLKSLNNVHHSQSTVQNSANIVSMGIHHEDKNQLIKALRMYTIAYRMRRDSLGVDHPSLAVLLNMMGSVQVKRGEYGEAMKIYELSLKGRPDENGGCGRKKDDFRNMNPLTTSVTLRDMGMILEYKGNEDKALKFYHASLRYAVKFKSANDDQQHKSKGSDDNDHAGEGPKKGKKSNTQENDWLDNMDSTMFDEPFSLKEVCMAKSTIIDKTERKASSLYPDDEEDDVAENGEMELFIEKRFDRWALSETGKSNGSSNGDDSSKFYYDELFLLSGDQSRNNQQSIKKQKQGEAAGADMDIAMTLHQIGQVHRRSHRYSAALSAYNASLRGMKEVLGAQHGNIAAILGNIGNLYMETGDYDEAFAIYQEVLGIETMHLGLSHPEVAVTLHNIATIECSRGNFSEGVSLYKQVVDMQKIRYGNEHLTVAITLSCLADAYEKLRNVSGAMKTYEEALKIRIAVLGKSHLDVGRLMHKLGRLASSRKDYAIADIYMMRAMEIYKANKLQTDHVFMREMARDNADIQAGLAFAK